MDPQNDPELVHKLAALTEDEFNALVIKSRGTTKEGAAKALAQYVKRNTAVTKGQH